MSLNKLIPVLVVLLPIMIFWQSRSFDFVWDDETNISTNKQLNPVTTASVLQFWQAPYERLYIPVSYTVWAMIAPFAGGSGTVVLAPGPFHIANVVLHALSALMVFFILRITLHQDLASGVGALLFALHPVQVESVAWITGMKDILSGLLSLVALWQYLVYALEHISPVGAKTTPSIKHAKTVTAPRVSISSGQVHYAIASVAFILGCLAKPAAIVTPVIALLLDCVLLRRPWQKSLTALLPWTVVSLIVLVVTAVVQPDSDLEYIAPLWVRPLVAADALAFYLYKLFLPFGLVPDYGRVPQLVIGQPWIFLTASVPVFLALFIFLGRRERRWSIASAAIFVVGTLPVLGFLPFSFQNLSTVADRYLYLSMLGPAYAAASFLNLKRRQMILVFCLLGVVGLGLLSALQTRHWRNNLTLFSYILTVNPGSWNAHYGLGRALAQDGHKAEAITAFRAAVRLKPEFTNAHFSLGALLAAQGDLVSAVKAYRDALKIAPSFISARVGLANALARLGDLDGAVAEYHAAIRLDPGNIELYMNLGNLFLQQNQIAAAAQVIQEALKVRPDFAEGHHRLGRILAALGDLNGATKHFREAVHVEPNFAAAHESLALALEQQGKHEESQRHIAEARRLQFGRAP